MGADGSDDVPRLILEGSRHPGGTVLLLSDTSTTVGRDPTCTLRLNDPVVSRTHAVFERSGDDTLLRDLGSTNGTSVNGTRVATGPARLHDGDVISFGGLEARFCTAATPGDRTEQVRVVDAAPEASAWRIGDQSADRLSNVGRDQFNFYAEQRESFLREIAAAKTKARRLIWTGFGIFCVGLVIAAFGWSHASHSIFSADSSNPDADFQNFGAGFGVFALGGFVYGIGGIVMVVGFVLHVVAAARRRRGEAQFGTVGAPGRAGG